MSLVKAPFFSLGASGKFGNKFEVRKRGAGHEVIPIRTKPSYRTQAQQGQSDRFKVASTAWNGLTTQQKLNWKTASHNTGKNGYQYYISEYLIQSIQPPGQPTIP